MPGPLFGGGPFGDLPWGATPETAVALDGFQVTASLGILSLEVDGGVALVGFQVGAQLGALGISSEAQLFGFSIATGLGVLTPAQDANAVALEGFDVVAELGTLTITQEDNSFPLSGFTIQSTLGVLHPRSIPREMYATASYRQTGATTEIR